MHSSRSKGTLQENKEKDKDAELQHTKTRSGSFPAVKVMRDQEIQQLSLMMRCTRLGQKRDISGKNCEIKYNL